MPKPSVIRNLLWAAVIFATACSTSGREIFFEPDAKGSDRRTQHAYVILQNAVFIDWTYPDEERSKQIFPGNKGLMKLSYRAMKYHGCIFEVMIKGKQQKFLVMVPRDATDRVQKIKNLYVSKDYVRIDMTYITRFPAKMWEFPQRKWPAMPVFMLDEIY